jgi:hypothetical protein
MSAVAEFLMADDYELVMDPETYVEAAGPAPVAPGTYIARVSDGGLKVRKNKEGAPVTRTSKLAPGHNFPVYVIEGINIVEPTENERKVMIFQDISLAPFLRNGTQPTSTLGDILRSYDASVGFTRMNEGIDLWKEFVERNATFPIYLDWNAYDGDYARQAIEEATIAAGGNLADKDRNAIYAKAKLRTFKKFPRQPNGRYSHIWTGPTGNVVEGRPYICRFISAAEQNLKLGPVREFQQ